MHPPTDTVELNGHPSTVNTHDIMDNSCHMTQDNSDGKTLGLLQFLFFIYECAGTVGPVLIA